MLESIRDIGLELRREVRLMVGIAAQRALQASGVLVKRSVTSVRAIVARVGRRAGSVRAAL